MSLVFDVDDLKINFQPLWNFEAKLVELYLRGENNFWKNNFYSILACLCCNLFFFIALAASTLSISSSACILSSSVRRRPSCGLTGKIFLTALGLRFFGYDRFLCFGGCPDAWEGVSEASEGFPDGWEGVPDCCSVVASSWLVGFLTHGPGNFCGIQKYINEFVSNQSWTE